MYKSCLSGRFGKGSVSSLLERIGPPDTHRRRVVVIKAHSADRVLGIEERIDGDVIRPQPHRRAAAVCAEIADDVDAVEGALGYARHLVEIGTLDAADRLFRKGRRRLGRGGKRPCTLTLSKAGVIIVGDVLKIAL